MLPSPGLRSRVNTKLNVFLFNDCILLQNHLLYDCLAVIQTSLHLYKQHITSSMQIKFYNFNAIKHSRSQWLELSDNVLFLPLRLALIHFFENSPNRERLILKPASFTQFMSFGNVQLSCKAICKMQIVFGKLGFYDLLQIYKELCCD